MASTRRDAVLRRAVAGVAALVAMALGGTEARAAAAPASVWTLELDGGQKQCRLTLRGDADGKGAPVGMPPGCRLAFPGLKGVALWAETGDGRLQLDDRRGEALLAFDADGDGFRTTSPQGDSLLLKPASPGSHAALVKAAALSSKEPETAQPGQTQAGQTQAGQTQVAQAAAKAAAAKKPAATSEKPADVAGRYAVLRDKTRDTGCMVTLDDKAHGPGATLKARLAPACRDQGIVIFDPIGWQIEHGQLVLTARKGHTTELSTQEDGSWMNDPKKGKTLSLKRI